MKTFKKTFKFICDSCGEFLHADSQYCEKCGAETVRLATKEDYEKHGKAADVKHKKSRKVSDGLKKEAGKAKKQSDRVEKEKRKVEKEADRVEWEAEREADKAEWEAGRTKKKSD